jgi:hypothetical protein
LTHGEIVIRKKNPGGVFPGEYCRDRVPAQQEFFRAIRRVAPEVLEDLRGELLPTYEKINKAQRIDDLPVWTNLFEEPLFLKLYLPIWDWAREKV